MFAIVISILAGAGAGIGTGLAGMSAATIISPVLVTFLGMEAYSAIGIALASDVLASAVSAYTYKKNNNVDIKNGIKLMIPVLIFTLIGSYVSSLVDNTAMGALSLFGTLGMGLKFLFFPVKKTKDDMEPLNSFKRRLFRILGGVVVGFICGFTGAGGGIMMLLVLTVVLGFELKTAVGTSVFIMAFTAFTGSVSHFTLTDLPDFKCLIICSISTLIFARLSANYANKITPKLLNKTLGYSLTFLGIVLILINYLF
ncbi:MAG: sulfite exporter TauE/SafE family protein [Clostridia bacterium]